MRIKNSLQFVLGLVLAAFIFSGTAKAVPIDVNVPFSNGSVYTFAQAFNADYDTNGIPNDVDLGPFQINFNFTLPDGPIMAVTQMGVFFSLTEIVGLTYNWDGGVDLPYTDAFSKFLTGATTLTIKGNAIVTSTLSVRLTAVPVPPAAILFGSALLGIGFLSRRRRRKKQKNSMVTAA